MKWVINVGMFEEMRERQTLGNGEMENGEMEKWRMENAEWRMDKESLQLEASRTVF